MTVSMNDQSDNRTRIRPASPDDLEAVLALFRQLWPDKVLNKEHQGAVFHAMLQSDVYGLLCAEMNGLVSGFASFSIQHNFWQEGRILYITTMIVDEKCRGQGIGTALIHEIKEIARGKDCKRIELESAFHRTDAYAFYEKEGFEKRAYFFSMDVK
jgi:ribosomal protein S18 acetylase RimI-like enzyme